MADSSDLLDEAARELDLLVPEDSSSQQLLQQQDIATQLIPLALALPPPASSPSLLDAPQPIPRQQGDDSRQATASRPRPPPPRTMRGKPTGRIRRRGVSSEPGAGRSSHGSSLLAGALGALGSVLGKVRG